MFPWLQRCWSNTSGIYLRPYVDNALGGPIATATSRGPTATATVVRPYYTAGGPTATVVPLLLLLLLLVLGTDSQLPAGQTVSCRLDRLSAAGWTDCQLPVGQTVSCRLDRLSAAATVVPLLLLVLLLVLL